MISRLQKYLSHLFIIWIYLYFMYVCMGGGGYANRKFQLWKIITPQLNNRSTQSFNWTLIEVLEVHRSKCKSIRSLDFCEKSVWRLQNNRMLMKKGFKIFEWGFDFFWMFQKNWHFLKKKIIVPTRFSI